MSANKPEPTTRTTVSVYTPAHDKVVDAIHALRKQKPRVVTSVTAFASEAITEAANRVLCPKSKSSKA